MKKNNGGSTDYYSVPMNAKDLQDLIEYKEMNFSIGNIFKACYRMGACGHSDRVRDLNKIVWFAQRELARLEQVEKTKDAYDLKKSFEFLDKVFIGV
ncbi:MAG: hypothetical protein ACRC6E_08645, partial [Fusobacteriaceae bacterium]